MSKHKQGAVGIDMVNVSRFRGLHVKAKRHLLKKIFTEAEIVYCSSFKEQATHFAGVFACKEASSKALGVYRFPVTELEIRHDRDGAPEVWHKGKKLSVRVSITHTDKMAAAVAII